MSAVRDAIRAQLLADSTLMALLATPTGSVFHRVAPQTARVPVIVFEKRPGARRVRTFVPTVKLYYETWAIRGIAFGRTADRAEDISARIEVVMDNATLVVAGRAFLDCRHESDIDYTEQVGKEMMQHSGAIYRIITE